MQIKCRISELIPTQKSIEIFGSMVMRLRIVSVVLLWIISYNGYATSNVNIYYQEDNNKIYFCAKISSNSVRAVKKLLKQYKPDGIILESHGGRIKNGIKLAKLIKKYELDTYTMRRCHSACLLAYVEGKNRYKSNVAKLGFHQTYYSDNHNTYGLIGDSFYFELRSKEPALKKRFLEQVSNRISWKKYTTHRAQDY